MRHPATSHLPLTQHGSWLGQQPWARGKGFRTGGFLHWRQAPLPLRGYTKYEESCPVEVEGLTTGCFPLSSRVLLNHEAAPTPVGVDTWRARLGKALPNFI
jgi:hypothetical protein